MLRDNDHLYDGSASVNDPADVINTASENTSGCMAKVISAFFWANIILIELVIGAVLSLIVFTGVPEKIIVDHIICPDENTTKVPEFVSFPVSDEARFSERTYIDIDSISFAVPQTGKMPEISRDEFENAEIIYNDDDLHYKLDIRSPVYSPIAEYNANWREWIRSKPEIDLSDEDLLDHIDFYELMECSMTRYGFDSFAKSKGLQPIDSYFDICYTMYYTTPDDWRFWDAERAKTYMAFIAAKNGLQIPEFYFENDCTKGFVEDYGSECIEDGYKYECRVSIFPQYNEDLEYTIVIHTDDMETMNCILDGIGKTQGGTS